MDSKKKIIYNTLALAFFVFSFASIYQKFQENPALVLQNSGYTSVGKAGARIEVVLVEDFQCKKCRAFSQKVIPRLDSKYVKSGKVRFTLVPVSFLSGSQEIANAVLEVYAQSPSGFISYLEDLLIHDGDLKKGDLLRLARRVRGVDLERLQQCIEQGWHNQELDKNLNWARNLMGNKFRTPALYVNGNVGSTYSFEAIEYQIEQILGSVK